jgi:hypothetical protein
MFMAVEKLRNGGQAVVLSGSPAAIPGAVHLDPVRAGFWEVRFKESRLIGCICGVLLLVASLFSRRES